MWKWTSVIFTLSFLPAPLLSSWGDRNEPQPRCIEKNDFYPPALAVPHMSTASAWIAVTVKCLPLLSFGRGGNSHFMLTLMCVCACKAKNNSGDWCPTDTRGQIFYETANMMTSTPRVRLQKQPLLLLLLGFVIAMATDFTGIPPLWPCWPSLIWLSSELTVQQLCHDPLPVCWQGVRCLGFRCTASLNLVRTGLEKTSASSWAPFWISFPQFSSHRRFTLRLADHRFECVMLLDN